MVEPADLGAFLAFLDPHVPLLVALLVGVLVLFARWLETGDRSAYAVGAAAAWLVPAWLVGAAVVHFAYDRAALLPDAAAGDPAIAWPLWALGLVLVVALAWFTLRPLWITGLFLFAPQAQVRRRFKALETSWQFAVGTLVAVKALVLLVALVRPWT